MTTDCQLNLTVNNGDGATIELITDLCGVIPATNISGNRYAFNVTVCGGTGASVVITKSGCKSINHRLTLADGHEVPIPFYGAWELESETLVPNFPAVPTRDQVCAVQTSFQGLKIQTQEFGLLNWFEACLISLNENDRQAAYQAKEDAGDTHCIVSLSWNYQEPDFGYSVPGRDLTNDLTTWVDLIIEVIENGFTPIVMFPGDGDSNPNGGYNDPVGWTYGFSWLVKNLPLFISKLQNTGYGDITPYCLFCPGYDGVFYGWTGPNDVETYIDTLRGLIPNCHAMLEHTAGNPPLGEGGADFLPGGRMLKFDVVASEFAVWPTTDDTIWQIGARFLGPDYVRPPNQPVDDDPGSPFGYGNPKFYIQYDTPRGKMYVIAFELATYYDVRGRIDHNGMINCGQYYKAAGWSLICVPNWARL